MKPSSHHRRTVCALTAWTLVVAGCGGDDDDSDSAASTPVGDPPATTAPPVTDPPPTTAPPVTDPPATTAPPVTDPPAATAPPSSPPETARTPAGTETPGPDDDELTAQIEAVLTDAIAPGSIRWDSSGIEAPPTAAVAAVRIPGRDDVLVAVGTNVDGTPTEADAPYHVGTLGDSLVRSVAFRMVDDGVLDPTSTVERWVPTYPNANRVTVQMLLDNTTGWSDWGPITPDPVVGDFGRSWSLREAVELRATVTTALDEPGTMTDEGLNNETVLGLVVEEVGGRPLAELVRLEVAEPAGLDHTNLSDGRESVEDFRYGVVALGGSPADTSSIEPVSFMTWWQATHSVISTPSDLLDLLDVWESGGLFTTDRTLAPDRLAPDPAGNPETFIGVGIPFNAYCPCTEVDGGIEPAAIGRVPGAPGTRTVMLRYVDGISVVVNVNSNEADSAEIRAVANVVHDTAAATL